MRVGAIPPPTFCESLAQELIDERLAQGHDASWRGRIRACRGVGAELDMAAVERFDAEPEQVLGSIAGERFTVLHRLEAHILARK